MIYIEDTSGANIDVQIFDSTKFDVSKMDIKVSESSLKQNPPVILVMDYAFGEQAYETLDELLKPINVGDKHVHLDLGCNTNIIL
mgnify:CR=1 FL=1